MSGAVETLNAPRAVRSVPDSVLGTLGGVMMLLALFVLLQSVISGGDGVAPPAPLLAIVSPTDGSVVDGPLVVQFDVQATMQAQAGGWGVGGYHLHLHLDGLELMPAPADLRPGASGYQWVVGPLEAGTHRMQLYWADEHHRRVEEGASEVVVVEAR